MSSPTDQQIKEACFFRKQNLRKYTKWHRVFHYYPVVMAHLAYCGELATIDPVKYTYSGEWNKGEFDDEDDRDCDTCETIYHLEK